MENEFQRELMALLSRLCDEDLSQDEADRLATMLASGPEAQLAYVQFFDLHLSLKRSLAHTQLSSDFQSRVLDIGLELQGLELQGFDELPEESTRQLRKSHAGRTRRSVVATTRFQSLVAVVAVALLAVAGAWWFYLPPTEAPDAGGRVVAQLLETKSCVWAHSSTPLVEGASLREGQYLQLQSGIAKLEFGDQTTALIESPASVKLISDSSLWLHSGTVALRADGPKKRFVVRMQNASIVDLGTSFGVHRSDGGTEVEVFEGSVEVFSSDDSKRPQLLGIGASALLKEDDGETTMTMFPHSKGRFTDLLQMLWEDVPVSRQLAGNNGSLPGESEATVFPRAEFNDLDVRAAVDSFHRSTIGRGWVSPWISSRNPLGEIVNDGTLTGPGNPYLKVRFYRTWLRTIAREYGATESFDPEKPHIISWLWRYDGTIDDFGDTFADRITFFGNSYFRGSSSEDVTWFIGWTGGSEEEDGSRSAIPKRWFFFDGAKGLKYEVPNMVDTGMRLKPDVTYRMAVIVYPQRRVYDAFIQDDEKTFVKERLCFRSHDNRPGRVVHFSVGSTPVDSNPTYSIDAIRIEPYLPGGSKSQPWFDADLVNSPGNSSQNLPESKADVQQ